MKNFKKIFILIRVLAALLGFIPVIMIFPLIMAISTGERSMIRSFAIPIIIITFLSAASILSLRRKKLDLNAKDGFLLVFAVWVLASFTGAIPFFIHGMSFANSFFESACTFATTGATTISNIEILPRSLLLYRSIAHWFGGIGIVLVSVALLPILGVGGFQLFKAEEPGPDKEKVTPKIAATTRLLLLAYSSLTLILFSLYLTGGMSPFEAVCHCLTTMATGGVSVKNTGLASYNSKFIEAVTSLFFLLAGVNFTLYYRLLQGKLHDIKNNTEVKVYFTIFIIASAIVTISLLPQYGSISSALRYATFHCASILSTAGSAIVNLGNWPPAAKMIIFILMFIGGCSGSTAGGFKVIRMVILWKQTQCDVKRIIHPNGIFNIQINKRIGRSDIVYGAAGFFFIYFSIVAAVALITSLSGYDIFSSFFTSLSITGNIGMMPAGYSGLAIKGLGNDYNGFPNHLKWLYSFVMISGRLEIWTVIVIFSKNYWKK